MIFAGRAMAMIFIKPEEVLVLDAAQKYLRCMGYFFWSLGILNVCRMSTQDWAIPDVRYSPV